MRTKPMANREPTTIAILHPGEMGARIGEVLAARGHRVLVWTQGRSPATRRRAEAAGFCEVASLSALANRAEIALSLVPPAAAEATAQVFADALAPGAAPLFADLNSIGPDPVRRIAERLGARGIPCVDGALHGQAQRLPAGGVLYLSGVHASRVAALFDAAIETRLLGSEIGAASLLKLLLSCVSKSMVALCFELGAAAQEALAWPAFWEAVTRFYPELASAVERMGPTLPRHAVRRAVELAQAETWLRATGRDPGFAAASRRSLEQVAAADLPTLSPESGAEWRLPQLIEALRAHPARGAQESG
jgi:3-hydroxyisobutyrate dehydrogenase-like beta-hydroxyacid dehydrogenase